MNKLQEFIKSEYQPLKTNPALKTDFRVGDVVKIHQMIKEITTTKKNVSKTAKKALEKTGGGDKGPVERIQVFEGVVIAKKHGAEPGASFTVRKIASGGVAVEKIYPLYSPTLKKIEVVSRPKVRQAKLYYLRDRVGKAARRAGLGVAVEQPEETIIPESETVEKE
ncbi:MAG: 50S ribosomal protein L19 [Parcubacteria group bacterium]|nr:50S ribosomal protein L19 [Parcubacteria group bacterium]